MDNEPKRIQDRESAEVAAPRFDDEPDHGSGGGGGTKTAGFPTRQPLEETNSGHQGGKAG